MNKNIFVELTCASTIQNVLVEKRDGVTWLRSSIDVDTPSPRPLCVNVLVKIDDLISDFFELATLIEKNIDLSKYVPMYYDDFMCFISERIKRQDPDKFKAADVATTYLATDDCIDNKLYSPFSDKRCIFLQENSKLIIRKTAQFFAKYGLPSLKAIEEYTAPASASSVILLMAPIMLNTSLPKSIYSAPVSYWLYLIFELYLRYSKPSLYEELLKRTYYTPLYDRPQIKSNISIELTYTQASGWAEAKKVKTLFDAITLFLFYDDTREVKCCQYCGRVFVSSKKTAIYCSPSCRNCANSKKSYERRKGLQPGSKGFSAKGREKQAGFLRAGHRRRHSGRSRAGAHQVENDAASVPDYGKTPGGHLRSQVGENRL